jgi:hypothetical protein
MFAGKSEDEEICRGGEGAGKCRGGHIAECLSHRGSTPPQES